MNCKYCGKLCKNKNSLVQHEIRCSKNTNRIESTFVLSKFTSGRDPWNKGLTKYTDERVLKQVQSYKQNHPPREKDILETLLDDDGLLYQKYKAKCYNGKFQGHECLLTFHEYCLLVQEAGLVSSQLGYKGEKYDLARYNDEGNYEIGNCRFITHKENLKERKVSDAIRASALKASEALLESRKRDPDTFSKRIKEGQANSKRFQEIRRIAKEKEAIRQANAKKTHSTYGKHWITDGSTNKFWDPKSGGIPEGFYLGRVIKKKE